MNNTGKNNTMFSAIKLYQSRNLLLIILISFSMLISAQEEYEFNFIDTLVTNIADEELVQVDTLNPELNVSLNIQVFAVNSIDGAHHVEESDLLTGVNLANQYFSNIGIHFTISEIKIVPEYEYAFINSTDSIVEIETKYARENHLNLFLVDSILQEGVSGSGFTFYPGDSIHSSIFLAKDYSDTKILTLLLGKFFGLLETHEVMGGPELVNQTNCRNSGDYLCDTYADPNLLGKVNDECIYTGSRRDLNDEYYIPSVANLMSLSKDACKCIFTLQQYRRIKYYYKNYRFHLK